MANDETLRGPDFVPGLTEQPVCGDEPNSIQQVNRYGTYEIQPTADSHNFFPAIAQGSYSDEKFRKLRRQCRVEAEAQKDRKG